MILNKPQYENKVLVATKVVAAGGFCFFAFAGITKSLQGMADEDKITVT